MTGPRGCKQSLYFPEQMLAEMHHEAQRQKRSLSWIVQQAWRAARPELRRFPGVNQPEPARPRTPATTATPMRSTPPGSTN